MCTTFSPCDRPSVSKNSIIKKIFELFNKFSTDKILIFGWNCLFPCLRLNQSRKKIKIRYPTHFKHTVKPVLSDHSKIDKTNFLMTNGSLMKVESIAECSPWSNLQYV